MICEGARHCENVWNGVRKKQIQFLLLYFSTSRSRITKSHLLKAGGKTGEKTDFCVNGRAEVVKKLNLKQFPKIFPFTICLL